MDGLSILSEIYRHIGSSTGSYSFIDSLDIGRSRDLIFLITIASTKTSTIPGVSIAGKTPKDTLYTPALDVEYLVAGKPLTIDTIPITPDGIPTPALVSRSLMVSNKISTLVVDSGSYIEPKIPHIDLPSRIPGESIDTGNALPEGTSRKLYSEARVLGESIGYDRVVFIGESMPGGTTTAMAIMEALGFRARGRVSSAGPNNPHDLKWGIVSKGFRRAGIDPPVDDVFSAIDRVGDPLHVSIAGIADGAISSGGRVVLAGGTQMCSVLAILRRLGVDYRGRLAIATTYWLYGDRSSDIQGLVNSIDSSVPIYYTMIDFSDSPFDGLRRYDEGYVKEGVGMGGYMFASLVLGVPLESIKRSIYSEYDRLIKYRKV